jgi:cytochrome c oxidase subunit 4
MSQSHSHAAHADTHSHGEHHAHGWQSYLYILLTLLVLTVITVGASRINFGSPAANVVIALTIATIKATLVALFFMHLKDDKPINGLIFVSTLLFLGVFLGFCLIDADSRWDTRPASYQGPVNAPAQPLLDTESPKFADQVDPRKAAGAKPHSGPAAH